MMTSDLRKNVISKREFLTLGAASAGGMMFFQPKPANSKTFLGGGNDKLPGKLANAEDIDLFISELNNKLSQISLANNQALEEECQAIMLGAQKSIHSARAALATDLDEAKSDVLISSVGAALSGISFALLFVSTSPIWLVTAGGLMVAAATVPFALSLCNASSSDNLRDGVVVATSFTSGRLSMIASAPNVSTTARLTGRSFGALAAGVDAVFAIRSWANVAQIRTSLKNLNAEAEGLRAEAERLRNDLGACREARMIQVQESIEGLKYIRDLSAMPGMATNPGELILP